MSKLSLQLKASFVHFNLGLLSSIILQLGTLEFSVLLQLVELKNGETYNGHMVQCDSWMNVHLREVICTSKVSFCPRWGWRAGLADLLFGACVP